MFGENKIRSFCVMLLCLLLSLYLALQVSAQIDQPQRSNALEFTWENVDPSEVVSGVVWQIRRREMATDVVLEIRMFGRFGYVPLVAMGDAEPLPQVRFDRIQVSAEGIEELSEQLNEQLDGFEVEYLADVDILLISEAGLSEDLDWPLNKRVRKTVGLTSDCQISIQKHPEPVIDLELDTARHYFHQYVSSLGGDAHYLIISQKHDKTIAVHQDSFPAFDPSSIPNYRQRRAVQ
ncbi:hypothetical protein KQI84_05210 [bacterium]|nr:hypothetical protein [bacterium]